MFRQAETMMVLHLPEMGEYHRLWCSKAEAKGWKEVRPITFVSQRPTSFSKQYKYCPLGASECFRIFRRINSEKAFNLAHALAGLPDTKTPKQPWQKFWASGMFLLFCEYTR